MNAAISTSPPSLIAKGALIYVHLLILEGAARKWLPGTDNIFYVARDVCMFITLALAAQVAAYRRRPTGRFWLYFYAIGVISLVQLAFLELPLSIIVVGARSYIAPFLLLFAAYKYYLSSEFIQASCKVLMIYAPIEALITVAQVASPPNSTVNKQVGSDAAYFVNDGIVRASGTFSAPSGLALYVPLALAVSLAFVTTSRRGRYLTLLASISCLLTAGLSGARTTLLAVAIVLLAFGLLRLVQRRSTGSRGLASVTGLVVAVGITSMVFFSGVLASFAARFQAASRAEDSGGRIVRQTLGFLDQPLSVLGDGMGMHAQAGIALGAPGPWLEIDGQRIVAELGILGFAMAVARLGLVVYLFVLAATRHRRNDLFVLVVAATLPVVAFGQISQFPAAQGFFSLAMALLLASTTKVEPAPTPDLEVSDKPHLRRLPL